MRWYRRLDCQQAQSLNNNPKDSPAWSLRYCGSQSWCQVEPPSYTGVMLGLVVKSLRWSKEKNWWSHTYQSLLKMLPMAFLNGQNRDKVTRNEFDHWSAMACISCFIILLKSSSASLLEYVRHIARFSIAYSESSTIIIEHPSWLGEMWKPWTDYLNTWASYYIYVENMKEVWKGYWMR